MNYPLLTASLLLAATTCFGAASAQAPPDVNDADMDDVCRFAADVHAGGSGNGICFDTPASNNCSGQPPVTPCASLGTCGDTKVPWFLNGYDLTMVAAAWDGRDGTLYLGMRSQGVIGDADGDGTAAEGVHCQQGENVTDPIGFGETENYTWFFDTDLDGWVDFGIKASGRSASGKITAIELTDASGSTTVPLTGNGSYGGHDLELEVTGLPSPLPATWRLMGYANCAPDHLVGDFTDLVSTPSPVTAVPVPELAVSRATPNPFRQATTVSFSVAESGRQVILGIYDLAGHRVRALAGGGQAPGWHRVSWDGRTDAGEPAARGVYFLSVFVDGKRAASGGRVLYLR